MKNALFSALEERFQDTIKSDRGITGGDINQALHITFEGNGSIFVKYNGSAPADLFEKEAIGLKMLKRHALDLRIPDVLDYGVLDGGLSFLALEFIETSGMTKNHFEKLGQGIAHLHKTLFSHFGSDHDNYIGLLPQKNAYRSTFSDFFWEMRILPQLQLAVKNHHFTLNELGSIEHASKQWTDLFPTEEPVLIHGDLWAGNIFTDSNGNAGILDPAVYYSHREMELAFTHLFGGFDASFYHAYSEILPLSPGFEQRKRLYQLYPVLVHVNLFGGAYANQARTIINEFS